MKITFVVTKSDFIVFFVSVKILWRLLPQNQKIAVLASMISKFTDFIEVYLPFSIFHLFVF